MAASKPSGKFVPYPFEPVPVEESLARGRAFHEEMDRRRSCRFYSTEDVPREAIELAIKTASTAPSGAHRQPWTFVVVRSAELKARIRSAAEKEEYEFYEGGRAPDDWLEALAPLGTGWEKPFLTEAPWIVVVFEQLYALDEEGERVKHYYTKESVGIACGLFIAALHRMGLVTLTHTPSPMKFLGEVLGRPKNERPYILFPVGYPAEGATVPELERKSLRQVSAWDPGQA